MNTQEETESAVLPHLSKSKNISPAKERETDVVLLHSTYILHLDKQHHSQTLPIHDTLMY